MENLFLNAWILLAQGQGGAGEGQPNFLIQMLVLFVPIGILFWFLIIRPQRREAAKRQEMLSAIKKNDRVVTIGGIHGIVTNVLAEKGKVIIRVDETTNTKLEVAQSAIARVVVEDDSDDK